MGYAKERGKLEKLQGRIVNMNTFDQKNLAILVDSHEKYSHTVRILKNKEPEAFTEFYTTDLQAIKDGRKAVKEAEEEEPRQQAFIVYKNAILSAIEKTIATTLTFV